MGKVIPLRQLDPSASVQKALSDLRWQCSTERFKGFIFLVEDENGEQIVGTSGIFATDLDRAAQAVKAGFSCLLGQSRCIEDVEPKSRLPRRLRNEEENEKTCDVVACAARHRIA